MAEINEQLGVPTDEKQNQPEDTVPNNEKKCRTCELTQENVQFYKHKSGHIYPDCKKCHNTKRNVKRIRGIDALSPAERQIVVAGIKNGVPYRTIAAPLGISAGTISLWKKKLTLLGEL